jgi:GTP-binding protein LepA
MWLLTFLSLCFCSPQGSIQKPFRALLFDSWYDKYVGVVCMLGVVDGVLRKGIKKKEW